MNIENNAVGVSVSANVDRAASHNEGVSLKNYYHVECVGPDGNVKWVEEFGNLVTNEGLDYILESALANRTVITAWYVGLTDGTPTEAATDVMNSHVGWSEVVAYTEGTREALTLPASDVSGQSVTNSASKASFSINADTTTIGGAFITSDSTKSGTTGQLYSVGDFTGGDKSADSGDTLNVTVTLTSSAS